MGWGWAGLGRCIWLDPAAIAAPLGQHSAGQAALGDPLPLLLLLLLLLLLQPHWPALEWTRWTHFHSWSA